MNGQCVICKKDLQGLYDRLRLEGLNKSAMAREMGILPTDVYYHQYHTHTETAKGSKSKRTNGSVKECKNLTPSISVTEGVTTPIMRLYRLDVKDRLVLVETLIDTVLQRARESLAYGEECEIPNQVINSLIRVYQSKLVQTETNEHHLDLNDIVEILNSRM